MASIFGGEAAETPSTQPVRTDMPLPVNHNRLVGPIMGMDYLTQEIPVEILLMIVKKLIKPDKPRNFKENQLTLYRLSLVSRGMNELFERRLYEYNNLASRSFGFKSDLKMMREAAVTPAIPWAVLNNSLGTIEKAIKYYGHGDVVNLVTFFANLRRYFAYSFIEPSKTLATPLQFAAMSHGTSRAMIQALVRMGASLDEWRGYGATPLFIAAENGDWEMVVTFLELGARVHPKGQKSTGPRTLPPKLLYHILNWKGGIIAPSLNFHASRGQAIRLLIKKHPELDLEHHALHTGEDTDPPRLRSIYARFGITSQTILTGLIRRLSVDHDALQMVKLLLQLGLDPNAQERHTGQMPLVLAMMQYRNHFLAYHDANVATARQQKVDMERRMRRCVHAMELLLEHGAVVDRVPIPRTPSRDRNWVPLKYLSELSRKPDPLQMELALNLMYTLRRYNMKKTVLSPRSLHELNGLIFEACGNLDRIPFHV